MGCKRCFRFGLARLRLQKVLEGRSPCRWIVWRWRALTTLSLLNFPWQRALVQPLLLPLSRLLVAGPAARLVSESTSAFVVISRSLSMDAWYLHSSHGCHWTLVWYVLYQISFFSFIFYRRMRGLFIWELFLVSSIRNEWMNWLKILTRTLNISSLSEGLVLYKIFKLTVKEVNGFVMGFKGQFGILIIKRICLALPKDQNNIKNLFWYTISPCLKSPSHYDKLTR